MFTNWQARDAREHVHRTIRHVAVGRTPPRPPPPTRPAAGAGHPPLRSHRAARQLAARRSRPTQSSCQLHWQLATLQLRRDAPVPTAPAGLGWRAAARCRHDGWHCWCLAASHRCAPCTMCTLLPGLPQLWPMSPDRAACPLLPPPPRSRPCNCGTPRARGGAHSARTLLETAQQCTQIAPRVQCTSARRPCVSQKATFEAFRESLLKNLFIPNSEEWEWHVFYYTRLPRDGYSKESFHEDVIRQPEARSTHIAPVHPLTQAGGVPDAQLPRWLLACLRQRAARFIMPAAVATLWWRTRRTKRARRLYAYVPSVAAIA